jgi:hypothetical protein
MNGYVGFTGNVLADDLAAVWDKGDIDPFGMRVERCKVFGFGIGVA